jgi:hypothetical protein
MPQLAAVAEADHRSKSATLQHLLDAGVAAGVLCADVDVPRVEATLYGPMLFVAITGNDVSLVDLADDIADRFLACADAPRS